jgi:hypothetical protein
MIIQHNNNPTCQQMRRHDLKEGSRTPPVHGKGTGACGIGGGMAAAAAAMHWLLSRLLLYGLLCHIARRLESRVLSGNQTHARLFPL